MRIFERGTYPISYQFLAQLFLYHPRSDEVGQKISKCVESYFGEVEVSLHANSLAVT